MAKSSRNWQEVFDLELTEMKPENSIYGYIEMIQQVPICLRFGNENT